MIRNLLLFLSLFFVEIVYAQVLTIKGQVINKQTNNYLVGCSVFNVSKQIGTVTNEEGRFNISVEKGDLIQFTYVGMGVIEQYVIEDSEWTIEMTYQSRKIKAVTIKAEVAAKKSVLYNPKFEEKKQTFREPIRRTPEEYLKQSSPLTSPISFFYYSNKRVQRRLNAILDIEKLDASNLKYSLDFISLVTKVDDIDELKDIKAHCYFPHDEVLNSSYYELGLKLQDCYIEYLEERKQRQSTDSIPRDN